jgi:TRAP transporter TAXI family solute receptor
MFRRMQLVLLPLALAVVLPAFSDECKPGDLTILSGQQKQGYYYKVADAIAEVARNNGLHLCAIPVERTFDNVPRLVKGEADFAIAQSDVAHDAWFGYGFFAQHPAAQVRIVMPLYSEAIHILYRPGLHPSQLADLKNKSVFLGPPNSGTEFTTKHMLAAAGLKVGQDVTVVQPQDYCDAVARLKNTDGGLDVLFRATLVPSAEIEDALSRSPKHVAEVKPCMGPSEIDMLSLSYDTVRLLTSNGSYTAKMILRDDYHQAQCTRTIAVQALLLTNRGDKDPSVRKLAKILRTNRSALQRAIIARVMRQHDDQHANAVPQLALMDAPIDSALIPFVHEGAKRYILTWKDWWWHLFFWAIACVAPIAPLVIWKRKPIGHWFVHQPQFAIIVAGTLLIWCVAAVTLYRYENGANEHFTCLLRSFEYAFVYLAALPGYELVTPGGQLTGQIAKWLSLVLLGGFAGPLAKQGLDLLGKRMSGTPQPKPTT